MPYGRGLTARGIRSMYVGVLRAAEVDDGGGGTVWWRGCSQGKVAPHSLSLTVVAPEKAREREVPASDRNLMYRLWARTTPSSRKEEVDGGWWRGRGNSIVHGCQ